jgi:hypothetical protein
MQPLHLQYAKSYPGVTIGPDTQVWDLFFSTVLSHRGSDYMFFRDVWDSYRNRGLENVDFFSTDDTELLQIVVKRLMQDDACMQYIRVHDGALSFALNSALTVEYIVEVVSKICVEAGYDLILAPRPPSPEWAETAAKYALQPEDEGKKLPTLVRLARWWPFSLAKS